MAYLASFAVVLPTTFRAERNIQELVENKVRIAIGEYLSHTPIETTIAGEPLGFIGYYSRRTYYDYPGCAAGKSLPGCRRTKIPPIGQVLSY